MRGADILVCRRLVSRIWQTSDPATGYPAALRRLRGAHFLDFQIANRSEQPADFALVVAPLDVPLRLHLLVIQLLPIEFLFAGYEAGSLSFYIRVTAFGPGVQFRAPRFERLELLR